ncbi:MAG TPA: HTH domain-containing protein [Anaeromyxobacteraceae bacterium]|nr:HTH domain-containing protein [Anaeromyxobacteraceae bacterium]
MTFTEAAIEVLRREGKPLHFKKIAEIAIRESLLDHVGKIPEEVMGGQLATHCKLPHTDRKVVVVQTGTFALVEWGLDEDPAGLDSLIEPPPEHEIPYRSNERHPTPSREMARSAGRGEARIRRREEGEERRGRRYPPPAEVAYEILAGAEHPLSLQEIAAQGAERFLMPDAFVRDSAALKAALVEDNRRREAAGRKALFTVDLDTVTLAAQPEPGERAAAPLAVARPGALASEMRKSALSSLRRRVRECDGPTVEHIVARLLEAMGLRDLKVAKRGREHVVYTGRRRMGVAEVRHCVRILRAGGEPTRRDVTDVRRDVGNYGAQIGVVVSAGDAGRDARGEASAPGQLPVLLITGEALAEALTEHAVGCRPIVVPEIDEAFFKSASDDAQREEGARKLRREERDRREALERALEQRQRGPLAEAVPEAAVLPAADVGASPVAPPASSPEAPLPALASEPLPGAIGAHDLSEDVEEEASDEEGEGASAASTPGEESRPGDGGRRRRRRRRRRGGRGRSREGASLEGGLPGSAAPPSGGTEPKEAGTPAPRGDPGPSAPPSEGPREGEGGS